MSRLKLKFVPPAILFIYNRSRAAEFGDQEVYFVNFSFSQSMLILKGYTLCSDPFLLRFY